MRSGVEKEAERHGLKTECGENNGCLRWNRYSELPIVCRTTVLKQTGVLYMTHWRIELLQKFVSQKKEDFKHLCELQETIPYQPRNLSYVSLISTASDTASVCFAFILNLHLHAQSHAAKVCVQAWVCVYFSLSHTQAYTHILHFRSKMRWKSNCEARQTPAAISGMNTTIPLQTPLMSPWCVWLAMHSHHFIFLEGTFPIISGGNFVAYDS